MKIELNQYAFMIFSFFSFFTFFSLIFDGLVGHFKMFYEVKPLWVRVILVFVFIGICIWAFKGVFGYLGYGEVVTLLVTGGFGSMLYINRKKTDDKYDLLVPKYSIVIQLSRNLGHTMGPLLMVSSFLCILLFGIGLIEAKNKKSFYVLPDGKTVLLKNTGK